MMQARLDPTRPSAKAFARMREAINGRFSLARKARARLKGADFQDFLVQTLAPALDAVETARPDRVDPTLDALVELSLELFSLELLGPTSRLPEVGVAWNTLLIPGARMLAQDGARAFAGAITNAVCTLDEEAPEVVEPWIRTLAQQLPACQTLKDALALGRVLAWRLGAAPRRDAALRMLECLPAPLLRTALALPEDWDDPLRSDLLELLRRDPWTLPSTLAQRQLGLEPPAAPELHMAGSVGTFRGFGGQLRRPAIVTLSDSSLLVEDGNALYLLTADCFGQGLRPLPASFPLGPVNSPPGLRLSPDGTVCAQARGGELSRRFPLLAGARSYASTERTLAVSLPFSHRIYLVVLRGGHTP